ncbi:hypothetical protein, conserved [Eimeria maxima]|uniref:Uncharacterized protein n=1 Tax=Eimeria maxima TaxID=5804 RepID=U6M1T3_EIMMA|nr:hypothetical protein, conserved [Eimeria maxima]CDJ58182.1 hypothetical protein, conserved [Eimeria maxima]
MAPFRGGPSLFEFSEAAAETSPSNPFEAHVKAATPTTTTVATADTGAAAAPEAKAAFSGAAARKEKEISSNNSHAYLPPQIDRGGLFLGLYKNRPRACLRSVGHEQAQQQQQQQQPQQQQQQQQQEVGTDSAFASGGSAGIPVSNRENGIAAGTVEVLQAQWRLLRRAAQQQRQVLPYSVAANIPLLLHETVAALQQTVKFAVSEEIRQANAAATATAWAAEAPCPDESLLRLCLNVLAFGSACLDRQIKEFDTAAHAAGSGEELVMENLSLQHLLPHSRPQRSGDRRQLSSRSRNSQVPLLHMPPELLLQTAMVVVRWFQRQQERLAAGGSRLEALQPTEAAAAMRSLLLLLCYYAPLKHLQPAASAAAIPVYIHILQQQHALQWSVALRTYRALLLPERAVRQRQRQQQQAVTVPAPIPRLGQQQCQQQQQQQSSLAKLSSVASSFDYWNGGCPELYVLLDRALLDFLRKRALTPVKDGGSIAQSQQLQEKKQEQQQQKEEEQQPVLGGNVAGPVFSLAPVECSQLLLRPSACFSVRLAVGSELLQVLLLLQRDPNAYLHQLLRRGEGEHMLMRETSSLSTVAAAARNVLSWTDVPNRSTGSSSISKDSSSNIITPQQQVEMSCLRRELLQAVRGALLSMLFSSPHRHAVTISSDGRHRQHRQQHGHLLLQRLQAVAAISEVCLHQEVFTRPIASALLWEALMLLRLLANKETTATPGVPAAAAAAAASDWQPPKPVLTALLELAHRLNCTQLHSGSDWPGKAEAAASAAAGSACGEPALVWQATRFFGGSPWFLLELMREVAVQQHQWLVKAASLWGAISLQQQPQRQEQQQGQLQQRGNQQVMQPPPLLHAPQQVASLAAAIGCITSSLLRALWGSEGDAAALVYLQLQRAHSHLSALHTDPAFLPSLISMRLHWQQQRQKQQKQQRQKQKQKQQQLQQHIGDTQSIGPTDAWTLISRTDHAFSLWLKRRQQQCLLLLPHQQQRLPVVGAISGCGSHSIHSTWQHMPTDGVQQWQQLQMMQQEQLRHYQQSIAVHSWDGWEGRSSSSSSRWSGSYTIIPSGVLWEASLLQESAGLLASAYPTAALPLNSLNTQKHQPGQDPQELVLPLGPVLRAVKRQIAHHSASLHAEAPLLQLQRQTDEQLMQVLQQHLQQLQHQLQQVQMLQTRRIGVEVLADATAHTPNEHRNRQQQQKLQHEPIAAALRIQWVMHASACSNVAAPQTPEQLLFLLQDVRCLLRTAQTALEQRIQAAEAFIPKRLGVAAAEPTSEKTAPTSYGTTTSSPAAIQSGVGHPAEVARDAAAAASRNTTSSSSNSNSRSPVFPLGTQIRVSCSVIAMPLANPPAELLQLLALFVSPLWWFQVLPGLAASADQLHTCTPIRGGDAQHLRKLQQRVNLLMQLQELQQQQQELLQDLKRVLQLQQQRVTQQYGIVSSLRAAAEQRHRKVPREQQFRTKQQERQQARRERMLQRRVQLQEMEAEANKGRLILLSNVCAALAFSHEHFKQSMLRQLLLPHLLQQDQLLHRIEKLLQRCRRIGFLRRQLKKANSSVNNNGIGVPHVQQEQQQDQQQQLLRGEVMASLAHGINELHAVLKGAAELRQLELRQPSVLKKLQAEMQQQQPPQQHHQKSRRDAFAEWALTALCSSSSSLLQAAADLKTPPTVKWIIDIWRALLIEGVLHVSQQHSKQQDQQRQELQQQLFAALALRIRNQTAAGQQPLDVAELLSADCPLPPRVSAALFSLLYRHSLPLLLHPQRQQLLLFSAFRAEQEQHWARRRVDERLLSLLLPHIECFASGYPAATETAAAAESTSLDRAPWPAEWLDQSEELPSLFAYATQMAVFAAAAVAAVPSPLLPQEVADLWQQQRQQLVQERPGDTSAAAVAVPRKGTSHTLSTAELQKRIGSLLQKINASLLLQQDTWYRLRRILQYMAQQQQEPQQNPLAVQHEDPAVASQEATCSVHNQFCEAASNFQSCFVRRQSAGNLHMIQPSLQVLQQCSRLALAFCSWGRFECLALQLLLQVAAAAVHALRPLAPLWMQQQQQALQQAAAAEDVHPPLVVLQQQQLSRARAAIEEATSDLGLTVSLLQCLCPHILRSLMHTADLQRLLKDCDVLLEATAAARRHTPLSRPAAAAAGTATEEVADIYTTATVSAKADDTACATADADSLGLDAVTAVSASEDALEGFTAEAAESSGVVRFGKEFSDAETAKPKAKGGWDWNLLETEVASILRTLIPTAEGSPAKAAHMRVCGVACTRSKQDMEEPPPQQLLDPLQLQRQGKPLLLAFIFPADTWGRRQGILLPKKLLQLFLLRRLGWEVRPRFVCRLTDA